MAEQLLDAKQVSTKIGMSVTSIYEYMKKGTFPRPKRMGKQARRWRESDIDKWIESLPDADTDEWQSPNKPKRTDDEIAD